MLTWKTVHSSIPAQVVLIVPDQNNNVSALWELMLKQKGCVIVQEGHENAAQTCKVVNPALIVIDTRLPHTERLVLCSDLRAISSEPIILLVPDYNSKHMVEIYNSGVDECLLKPVSPAFLVIKAMSWLLRRRWLENNYESPLVQTFP